MDKKSTLNFKLQNSIIAQALRSEKMPTPCEASLAFIRNFAHNFRVQECGNGIVREYVLN
ncbi:MAG: hypothetical protein IJZ22_07310 [Bacteroidaceae bacterium]|nr:hypothetical protein [Bacteroidaceae bacterium]